MFPIALFQSELPTWFVPVISAGAVIVAALISGGMTWLIMRGKTGAETIKLLTETGKMMAEQLKSGATDLTLAMKTISRIDKEKYVISELAKKAEEQLAANNLIVDALKAEAASISENISHLSFMPTSEQPTPEDESAIRRLKEMRLSAKRMREVISNGTH